MTNHDVYRLTDVKINYYRGKPNCDQNPPEKTKDYSKKRCLLFDYSKKNVKPIIKVVKIFGINDEENETVFEFEIDNEENEEDADGNIRLSRRVNASKDNCYIVEIVAKKGEKLY